PGAGWAADRGCRPLRGTPRGVPGSIDRTATRLRRAALVRAVPNARPGPGGGTRGGVHRGRGRRQPGGGLAVGPSRVPRNPTEPAARRGALAELAGRRVR